MLVRACVLCGVPVPREQDLGRRVEGALYIGGERKRATTRGEKEDARAEC
jgi:hypothetical protein